MGQTLTGALARGAAQALVRLRREAAAGLAVLEARIDAASGHGGPGPGKADCIEAARLRRRLAVIDAVIEAMEGDRNER